MGNPIKLLLHQMNIRASLDRVVDRKVLKNDFRFGTGEFNDFFGKFENGEFFRIPEVHRSDEIIRSVHHADHAVDHVIHIAKGAGLGTVAENGDILVFECLDYKIAHHPAVVWVHPGAIGVEYSDHTYVHPVLPVIVKKERFRTALSFVVTGSGTDGIHIPPIGFILKVYRWIPVYFAGGSLKYLGPNPLGQPQHVDGAHDRSFHGLDRIVLVVHRGGRAGEIIDLIRFDEHGVNQIVSNQLEIRFSDEMSDVLLGAREKIVKAQHVMPFGNQPITQMRAQEAGAAGNQNSFLSMHLFRFFLKMGQGRFSDRINIEPNLKQCLVIKDISAVKDKGGPNHGVKNFFKIKRFK